MTREEMRYKLNEVRMMINDGEHGEEQGILVECIKALDSAEGEYIKKEDALKLQYRIDDSATLSTRDVVNVDDIDELPSYSFPEREKGEEDITVLDTLNHSIEKVKI